METTTQKNLLCRLLDTVTEEELALRYQYSSGKYPEVKIKPEVRD